MSVSNDNATLVDETKAAGYLGLSPRTLQRWRWKGIGPTYHKLGRRVLYRLHDLNAFVAQGKRESLA